MYIYIYILAESGEHLAVAGDGGRDALQALFMHIYICVCMYVYIYIYYFLHKPP